MIFMFFFVFNINYLSIVTPSDGRRWFWCVLHQTRYIYRAPFIYEEIRASNNFRYRFWNNPVKGRKSLFHDAPYNRVYTERNIAVVFIRLANENGLSSRDNRMEWVWENQCTNAERNEDVIKYLGVLFSILVSLFVHHLLATLHTSKQFISRYTLTYSITRAFLAACSFSRLMLSVYKDTWRQPLASGDNTFIFFIHVVVSYAWIPRPRLPQILFRCSISSWLLFLFLFRALTSSLEAVS